MSGARCDALVGPGCVRLSGPCSGRDAPNASSCLNLIEQCWRPYFVVRQIGSSEPDTGFSMSTAQIHRFLDDKRNLRCPGAPVKNKVYRLSDGRWAAVDGGMD